METVGETITEKVRSAPPKNAANTTSTHRLPIEIVEVKKGSQVKAFLDLPRAIYTEPNTKFVMPLNVHVKMMMGKLGTPQKHFFLAYAQGKPVARLGVKVHTASGHSPKLHFGFYECVPGFEYATKALFDHAHSLYPELEMMGPFQFRQEDPYVGVLVEGFDHEPYFMMPYNPSFYDEALMAAGLKKTMDLFTYDLKRTMGLPPLVLENAEKARKESNLKVRTLDPKNLDKEARIISGIFNEALKDNWGYEEFLEDQIKEMVSLFKLFIDPRVVAFANVDGRDVGCLLMIPNFNHILKPAKGRLGPKLVWDYLRRYKTTDSIRGYALGVLKEYQGKGIGSFLTDEMYKLAGNGDLYDECEVSWILANNSPMNDLAKGMGGKQSKVYRIYSKSGVKS